MYLSTELSTGGVNKKDLTKFTQSVKKKSIFLTFFFENSKNIN